MENISIYNSQIKDNETKRENIAKKLRQHGFRTGKGGDLLLVIGGDATFLSAVRKRMNQDPVFVGFNAGNLGYLSEFSMDEVDRFIHILKQKQYWIEEVPLYEVHFRDKKEQRVEYFINDFVVERRDTFALHMGLEVDGQTVGTNAGDAILVSTPLGSTAYNMSAGGAISLNHPPHLQITPIAPIRSRAYQSLLSPMIVKDDSDITIYPNVKKQREFRLVCDGKEVRSSNRVRFVEVKRCERNIRILRSNAFDPILHLKNKILTFE